MDLSKLSTSDLLAIQAGDLTKVSTEGLYLLSGQQRPLSTERTWGEAVSDVPAVFGKAVGTAMQIPGQLGQLITGNKEVGPVQELGQSVEEYWKARQSKGLQAREQLQQQAIDKAEQERGTLGALTTAFTSTITDPVLLSKTLIEQIPLMLGTGVVGGAVKVGTKAILARTAVEGVTQAAIASGAGVAVDIGLNAVAQGVDIGADTYEEAYKKLLPQVGEAKAHEQALRLGREAAFRAGTLSAAVQKLPGGSRLERAVLGEKSGEGMFKGALKTGLGESLSEGVEEGGGRFIKNVGMSEVDPSQRLSQGVGGAAGLGAAGGFGAGTIAGGVAGRGEAQAAAQEQRAADQTLQEQANRLTQIRKEIGATEAAQQPAAETPPAAAPAAFTPPVGSAFTTTLTPTVPPNMGVPPNIPEGYEQEYREIVQDLIGRGDTVEHAHRQAYAIVLADYQNAQETKAQEGADAVSRPSNNAVPDAGRVDAGDGVPVQESATAGRPAVVTEGGGLEGGVGPAGVAPAGEGSVNGALIPGTSATQEQAGDMWRYIRNAEEGVLPLDLQTPYFAQMLQNRLVLLGVVPPSDTPENKRARAAYWAGHGNDVPWLLQQIKNRLIELKVPEPEKKSYLESVAPSTETPVEATETKTEAVTAPAQEQQVQTPTVEPEKAPEPLLEKIKRVSKSKKKAEAPITGPRAEIILPAAQEAAEVTEGQRQLEETAKQLGAPLDAATRDQIIFHLASAAEEHIGTGRRKGQLTEEAKTAKKLLEQYKIPDVAIAAVRKRLAAAKEITDKLGQDATKRAQKQLTPEEAEKKLDAVSKLTLKTTSDVEKVLKQHLVDLRVLKKSDALNIEDDVIQEIKQELEDKQYTAARDKLFEAVNDAYRAHQALLKQYESYELSHTPVGERLPAEAMAAVEKGDLKAAIEAVAKNGSSPIVRTWARKILPALQGTTLEMTDKTGERPGLYLPNSDTILINPRGMHEHTLLHEALHAAVSHVLENADHPLTKELTKLYEDSKAVLQGEYAVKDVHEFVSEAWSNPEVNAKLQSDKKWWHPLVNAIRRFLGMAPLGKVNDAISKLLEIAPGVSRMGEAAVAEYSAKGGRSTTVSFKGSSGTAGNESVLAGLKRIDEDSDLLFDDPNVEGAVLISGVNRQDGGAPGRATEVLQAVTSWADANGETLALMPGMGSKDFLSKDQLEAWYERNGFVKRGSGLMVRKPQTAKVYGLGEAAAHMAEGERLYSARGTAALDVNPFAKEFWNARSNPKQAAELAKLAFDSSVGTATKKLFLKALTPEQMRQLFGKYTTSLEEAPQAIVQMEGRKDQLLRESQPFSDRWASILRKTPAQNRLLADVIHASTLAGIDPSKDKSSPTLNAMWAALLPETQKLYEDTRDFHADRYEQSRMLLLQRIERVLGKRPDTRDMTPEAAAKAIKDWETNLKKTLDGTRKLMEQTKVKGPYFPLARFGRYWIQINKKGDNDFVFDMSETKYEHERKLEEYKRMGHRLGDEGNMKQGESILKQRDRISVMGDLLVNIMQDVDAFASDNAATIESLKDDIYQHYLQTLPEVSMRNAYKHRKGVYGYSSDAYRAFVKSAYHSSTQLARLEFSSKALNAIDGARSAIRGMPNESMLGMVVEELRDRVQYAMGNVTGDEGLEKLTNTLTTTSFYYYLSSASSALLQMFSVPMLSVPSLVGEFSKSSTAKVGAVMSRYSQQILASKATFTDKGKMSFPSYDNVVGKFDDIFAEATKELKKARAEYNVRGLPDDQMWRLDYFKVLESMQDKVPSGAKRDEFLRRLAYEQGITNNVINSTLTADFSTVLHGPSDNIKSENNILTVANKAATGLFHSMEKTSREITYMSAYDLARSEGMSHTEAVKRATDASFKALGNFGQTNRPGIMLRPVARMLLQFKRFPLEMAFYLGKNAYDIYAGIKAKSKDANLTPEERKEMIALGNAARTRLLGTLAMTWAFAGMSGLPGLGGALGVPWMMQQFAMMIGKLGDDDDDIALRRNPETWFRQWLKEQTGSQFVADMINYGPVGTLTNTELSSRLSLNDLAFREPFGSSGTSHVSETKDWIVQLLGPVAAMGVSAARAWDQWQQGNYNRAVEAIMPSGIRQLMVAMRYAEEGVKTPSGKQVFEKEEVTGADIFKQMMGFAPQNIATKTRENIQRKGIELEITRERTDLMKKFDRAILEGKDVTDLFDKINEFNSKYYMLPITGEQLVSSVKRYAKNIAESQDGLSITKKLRSALVPD